MLKVFDRRRLTLLNPIIPPGFLACKNVHCGCFYFNQFRNIKTFQIRYKSTEKSHWRQGVVGCQPFQQLKVGPYKRGKWFVSFKDDRGSFIANVLIILVTAYSIFTLMPGESMKIRRQRKIKQLLLDQAGLTEAELEYIENYKLQEATETESRNN